MGFLTSILDPIPASVAVASDEPKKAAGCLVRAADTGRFLLAKRSDKVDDPNLWGTWGGSRDGNEQPEQTAEREFREETGYKGPVELKRLKVLRRGNELIYVNFLATVPTEFEPELNWETSTFAWVESGEWPNPKHWGLSALLHDVEKEFPPVVKDKGPALPRDPSGATGLYHASYSYKAYEILASNKFALSSRAMDAKDANAAPGQNHRWFYLSCSSSRYNPHAYANGMDVVFALDADAVKANYKIIPVDYWGREFRNEEHSQKRGGRNLRYDEHELRIVSTVSEMRPLKRYVKAVHINVSPVFRNDVHGDSYAKQVNLLNKLRERAEYDSLQVYWYIDDESYMNQVTSRSVQFSDVFPTVPSVDSDSYQEPDAAPRNDEIRKTLDKVIAYINEPAKEPAPFATYYGNEALHSFVSNIKTATWLDELNKSKLHLLAKMAKSRGLRSFQDLMLDAEKRGAVKQTPDREAILSAILHEYAPQIAGNRPSISHLMYEGSITVDGIPTSEDVIFKSEEALIYLEPSQPGTVLRYWWQLPQDIVGEYNWVDWDAISSYRGIGESKDDLRYMGVIGGGKATERFELMHDLVRYYGAHEFDHYPIRMRVGAAYFAYADSIDIDDAIEKWGLDGTYGYLLQSERYKSGPRHFAIFVNEWLDQHNNYDFPRVYTETNKALKNREPKEKSKFGYDSRLYRKRVVREAA